MRQLRMYVVFAMMLAVSAKRHEAKLPTTIEHRINKREDIVHKHQRDPGKLFAQSGKLHPVPDTNTTRLYDVRQMDGKARGLKNNTQQRNYHGLLQLTPPNQFMQRSYNVRGQRLLPRDGRSRVRYHNSRPRMQRSKQTEGLAGTLSRWFFSDDSEEVQGPSTRKFLPRHSSHRPSTYYNYPPFWSPGPTSHKANSFNSVPRFQKSRAVNHRPVTNNQIKFVKHECNACNSVPWTPILKPSAVHHQSFDDSGSYGVPTIDVHHDTSGYDTSHTQSILPPPAPVVEHTPDSTIPASYGLPLGNIPTAHGLLPPINHHNINPPGLVPPPPTILNPVPTDGLLHSIPFPELSPVPVVPLHDSNQFLQVDTGDLVPPIPPQKSVSNVIFTISENGPGPSDPIDNHISQGSDQHSESSSLINAHLLSHIQPYNHRFNPTNNHVNLDIVKSVPVAEYTSSIEYPLQVIQSPQYIDITTAPNATKAGTQTYEKQSQTGSQKISDILFGLVKDTNPQAPPSDSQISSTKLSEQSSQLHQVKPEQSNQYRQTNGPGAPPDGPQGNYIESGQIFHPNHQYASNLIQTDIYNPQPSLVWSGTAQYTAEQAQFANGNAPPFVNPPPHQPKFESGGGDELLPDPTSTTWLVPAQSNVAPQWILPVSNPPAVPYPLLPEEEGIASAVNGELSPSPPPQPMNNSKTKKVQIIIPYTTGENKDYDQSILESAHAEIQKLPAVENVSQVPPPQKVRVPTGQQVAEFTVKGNSTQNSKFLNDVHHILALNIKELLKDEVEVPKPEQNIRLQKNIDNWTALEYSNHKTVAKKEPLDVISYANAVTSIPGTSINHLLITSKKIPDKYLTTTPLPTFDEPTTSHFAGSGVSVESKPFSTKTYDTSGLYSTVTRIAPTTTTLKSIIRDVLKDQPNRNHRNGYTEVSKTKANQWSKLNENLVVPERVSNGTFGPSHVTQGKDEKVYVVTPVSVWDSNSPDSNKRTTRQVTMTESPEWDSTTITPEATKAYIAKLFGNKTERAKISKFNKPKPIQKFFPTTKAPPPWNDTKAEGKVTTPETVEDDGKAQSDGNDTDSKSINDVFPFRNGGELPVELAVANTTTEEIRVQGFGVRKNLVKQVKINKNLKKKDKAQTTTTTTTMATTEGLETTTTITKTSLKPVVEVKAGDNSTQNVTNPDEGIFGRKIVKGDKKNSRSKDSAGRGTKKSESEKSDSNLPPGIFGETKRVRLTPNDDDSPSVAALNETIRLLKEYLGASDELPEEKTEATEKLNEEDRP